VHGPDDTARITRHDLWRMVWCDGCREKEEYPAVEMAGIPLWACRRLTGPGLRSSSNVLDATDGATCVRCMRWVYTGRDGCGAKVRGETVNSVGGLAVEETPRGSEKKSALSLFGCLL
jgi:hypothetical protein